MRRKLPILLSAAFLALAVVGCEGPEGPQGDPGIAGPAGPTGPQGPAGTDALNTCSDCHDSDATIVAIENQFDASAHAMSATFEREGSCARCHNHQGFIAFVADGATDTDVVNPAPINCRTCHEIHTTYTDADYALTTTEPIEFIYPAGETADLGDGNLCGTCHMARAPGVVPVEGGAAVAISGTRFGTHYGTQSNTLAGAGFFEFTDFGTVTTANPHETAGCNTCHMAEPFGAQAGGHTWNMEYAYHGAMEPLTAGCTGSGCHTAMSDFGNQDVIAGLMTQVQTLLIAEGILVDENAHYGNPGTYDQDVIAAFLNWFMLNEDSSLGVHNPFYVQDVLENTLAMLQARQPAQ